jgi:hypothetical protein
MSTSNYLARLRFNKIIGTREGKFIKNFIQSARRNMRKPPQFSYGTTWHVLAFFLLSLQYGFIFKLRIVIFYGATLRALHSPVFINTTLKMSYVCSNII